MPDRSCEECLRLWREYQVAKTEAIRLDAIAMRAMRNHEDFRTAAAAAEHGADFRAAAREALTSHCSATGHRVQTTGALTASAAG